MATPKSVPFTSNDFTKSKPAYEIVVSGNWKVHDRQPNRANRLFTNVFINYVALFSLILLLAYVFVAEKYCTNHSLPNEIVNRVKFLETRVTLLENIVGNLQKTDRVIKRPKRSAEPVILEEENRGKKRNKSNRTRKIDIRAAHFTSSNLRLFVIQPLKGVIGPWSEELGSLYQTDSLGLKLKGNDRKVEISRAGIYFLYSQVTYESNHSPFSYSINMISADDETSTPISVCSNAGEGLPYGEVSCYTSIVRPLKPRDVIYLQQIKHSGDINMESSSTYFGIILFSEL